MKLNAPKQITWIIAVILGIVGILGKVAPIAAVAPNAFWLVTIGFVLLTLGTLLKDV
ncbi:MAG: hypothetical protein AAF657_12165 [Acidobacteriota bacterium]